uniref:Uncharacterized protein n=1 Tax=Manihot esculenta TaxID=3983 RepID=A0A2C9WH79_MANES
MNLEEKVTMDLVPPSEHLCYVRCNFCNTVLAVGIPCKRLLDTVTVKCGHCSNLSFLSTRPPLQGQCLDHQLTLQGFFSDVRKCQSSSSSSSTSSEPLSPKAPFVVKPPEKKHRLPSAYNRFMKEEIQRIKAANPEIPHREAFSTAAKNWARYIPNSAAGSVSGISNSVSKSPSLPPPSPYILANSIAFLRLHTSRFHNTGHDSNTNKLFAILSVDFIVYCRIDEEMNV